MLPVLFIDVIPEVNACGCQRRSLENSWCVWDGTVGPCRGPCGAVEGFGFNRGVLEGACKSLEGC